MINLNPFNNAFFDFVRKPFLGKYSISDIFRSILAFVFITITVSCLIFYIHVQIEERTQQVNQKLIEYVCTDKTYHDVVPGSVKFSVESIVEFPISHSPKHSTGYIIKDDSTGVRYVYINTGKNGYSVMTRYWEK